MAVPAFDTARRRETPGEAGFSPARARGILRVVADATGQLPSNDALTRFKAESRRDFAELRTEFAEFRSQMRTRISEFKVDGGDGRHRPGALRHARAVSFGLHLVLAAAVAGMLIACASPFQRSPDCGSDNALLAGFRDYSETGDTTGLSRAVTRGTSVATLRSQLDEAGFEHLATLDPTSGRIIYAHREMSCGDGNDADEYILIVRTEGPLTGAAEAAIFGQASYVPGVVIRAARPLPPA